MLDQAVEWGTFIIHPYVTGWNNISDAIGNEKKRNVWERIIIAALGALEILIPVLGHFIAAIDNPLPNTVWNNYRIDSSKSEFEDNESAETPSKISTLKKVIAIFAAVFTVTVPLLIYSGYLEASYFQHLVEKTFNPFSSSSETGMNIIPSVEIGKTTTLTTESPSSFFNFNPLDWIVNLLPTKSTSLPLPKLEERFVNQPLCFPAQKFSLIENPLSSHNHTSFT